MEKSYVYQIWSSADDTDEYISTTRQLTRNELNAFENIFKELSNSEKFEDYGIESLTAEACELFNARFKGVNAQVTDMPFISSIIF